MKWAYGVTTVPKRRDLLLPKTLKSLAGAGFDKPRLFVDGCRESDHSYGCFGLDVTYRWPTIRTHGNWFLSMTELFIREPTAQRYAIFQDDFVTYPNLRTYLEKCPYPDHGYLNLYTFPSNMELPDGRDQKIGWYKSRELQNGPLLEGETKTRFQTGRGAVALVFDRETLTTLLSSKEFVERPMDSSYGWRKVDGGIVHALNKLGYYEYVHNPSLVQHIGLESSMGSKPHKQALTFRGENFDALELLNQKS